ncbi:hypothetical protein XENOCAPTIV_006349, partial [Xenoophorus captivus]
IQKLLLLLLLKGEKEKQHSGSFKVQRTRSRCTPRPPPITPNLTSTGAPQSPPSESRQYRRTWPGRLCSSLWSPNGSTAPNQPETSPSKISNLSWFTG